MRVLIAFLLALFSSSCLSGNKCVGLDETNCRRNELCVLKTGPSSCSGGACTDDLAFKGCRDATSEEVSKRKKMDKAKADRKLKCTATHGEWKEVVGWCRCGERRFFHRGQGCTTLEKVCREEGGTLYSVGKFKCSDEMREKHPYYCPRGFSYGKKPIYTHNINEICLCKSGRPWDWNKQGCF